QVYKSIVEGVPIDVIDLPRRPFAVGQKPRKMVHLERTLQRSPDLHNSEIAVRARLDSACTLAALSALAPAKLTGRRIVGKNFSHLIRGRNVIWRPKRRRTAVTMPDSSLGGRATYRHFGAAKPSGCLGHQHAGREILPD